MTVTVQPASTTPDQVVWYRHPEQVHDHAFGTTSGYLRSKCGDERWTVLMALVDGSVRPCPRCLEAIAPRRIAPETESELRAMAGDR